MRELPPGEQKKNISEERRKMGILLFYRILPPVELCVWSGPSGTRQREYFQEQGVTGQGEWLHTDREELWGRHHPKILPCEGGEAWHRLCSIPGGVQARLDRALDTLGQCPWLGYLESALSAMARLGEVLEAGFSWMPEVLFLVFFILGVRLVVFYV